MSPAAASCCERHRLSPRVRALRILAGALLLQFSLGLVYVWGVLAPYVRADEHWPDLVIGSVWSAGPAGYAIGMVVAGPMADRLSPRRICWASLALMATGLGIAFVAPSAVTFPVFYSGVGLGLAGGVGMIGSIAVGSYALPGRPGAVGGAVTASYALAALVQVPLASGLAPRVGWVGALRVEGTALLAVSALALLLMPPLPSGEHRAHVQLPANPSHLVGRPLVLTGFLLEFCAGSIGADAFVNLATFARSLGVPGAVAALTVTVIAAGNAAGRLSGGLAADRVGAELVMLAVLGCDLVAAVLLAEAAGVFVLPAAMAAGLGFGGAAGLVSRLAARASPHAPNSAFGLVFVGYSAASFAGPLLGSALHASRLSWLALGAFPLAGVVLLAFRSRFARVPAH